MENPQSSVRTEIEKAFEELWFECLSADADPNSIAIAGKEEFIVRLEKVLCLKEQKETD